MQLLFAQEWFELLCPPGTQGPHVLAYLVQRFCEPITNSKG